MYIQLVQISQMGGGGGKTTTLCALSSVSETQVRETSRALKELADVAKPGTLEKGKHCFHF